ncbi:hypothetical protein L596_030893 [Steinernema carpocapsae]|uniref:Uncharacterized protein n=1 Tax=Steinernema carpocapsae TaxID=34508 RepID=A0A4U5LNI8_STECR|nr:hypothetical protein L596_030893 [Steinernema carpocapsae]
MVRETFPTVDSPFHFCSEPYLRNVSDSRLAIRETFPDSRFVVRETFSDSRLTIPLFAPNLTYGSRNVSDSRLVVRATFPTVDCPFHFCSEPYLRFEKRFRQ